MTFHKCHQSNQINMTDISGNQSEFRARGRSFIISGKKRRILVLSRSALLKCRRLQTDFEELYVFVIYRYRHGSKHATKRDISGYG